MGYYLIMKFISLFGTKSLRSLKQVLSGSLATLLVGVIFVANVQSASAASAVTNGAKVSFTFDDGFTSTYSKAAPTLAKYGFQGTAYITSSYIGTSGYMNWTKVKNLKNTYGWEIGGHSVTHPLMTEISASQLRTEVVDNKKDLVSRGLDPKSFATPFGDYNAAVVAEIARSYESHRPFHDTGYNQYPYDDYRLFVQQVQVGVNMATVKGYIDTAAKNGQWLILVFHDIKDRPSTDPEDYEYATKDLGTVASYVKSKGVPVTRISDATAKGTNVLSGGSFTTGLGNWTTDDSSAITIDKNSMGSAPESTTSVKLTANATKNAHLFSPLTPVVASKTYTLKTYLNVTAISSNEVGYYIDEYDANGNWISGKYYLGENSVYLQRRNITYTPTSTNVSKIRFQVVVPANSGITAYIDSIELLAQ